MKGKDRTDVSLGCDVDRNSENGLQDTLLSSSKRGYGVLKVSHFLRLLYFSYLSAYVYNLFEVLSM